MQVRNSSAAEKVPQLKPYQWKPGQSGNPKGAPLGTKRKMGEDFLADMHEAWLERGKEVIAKIIKNEPSVFLRVMAALMPRDIELTITISRAERLTDDELAGYLEAPDRADNTQAQESTQTLQPVGETK